MTNSSIEWTDRTWNFLTGCTKISAGCKNCYAERLSHRLKAMGLAKYENGFDFTIHEDLMDLPLSWQKPKRIFVNSMSDLFHEKVPDRIIFKAFEIMGYAYWHTFQILTKRSEYLRVLNDQLSWPDNVWMGVSVESEDHLTRIHDLKATYAKLKFLSMEPLLGQLDDLPLEGIDWVIVGGESGPGSRLMKPEWVTSIRDQCLDYDIPFFFKQWGGTNKKKAGRLLEGQTWDQMPKAIVKP